MYVCIYIYIYYICVIITLSIYIYMYNIYIYIYIYIIFIRDTQPDTIYKKMSGLSDCMAYRRWQGSFIQGSGLREPETGLLPTAAQIRG